MIEEPRTVDEAYQAAANTSDLRVVAERRGDGDVLIAAGMARSRFGLLLLRLVSEWDATSRRRPDPAAQSIFERAALQRALQAANLAGQKFSDEARQAVLVQARLEWSEIGQAEFGMRLSRAKSLPAAREQLRTMVAANALGLDGDAVLLWWLQSTCPVCDGRRWQTLKDTPALSGKLCPACRGSGERSLPGGANGKRLVVYIDDCLGFARSQIARRLRSDRGAV